MNPVVKQLKQEFEKNPRLVWGVAGIGLILLLYIWLTIGDLYFEEYAKYQDAEERLEEIQLVASDKSWGKRVKQSDVLLGSVTQKLWQSSSVGLAQADMQAKMNQLAKQFDMQRFRLKLGTPVQVKGLKDVWKVQGEMSAKFDAEMIQPLFALLAESERSLIVERLDFDTDRRKHITMLMSAYFLIQEASNDASN